MALTRHHVIFLVLLLSISLLPTEVSAATNGGSVPIIEKVEVPSVARMWNTVTLLYEDQFHDPSEVDDELENIHSLAPQLVDMEVIGESIEGRNITSLRITNELNTVQKAKTLVVAHHHGREQITVELALRFILYLLNGYGIDTAITEYVDTQEIYVIPTLNPDALEAVVNQGNHWLRKNLRPYDNDGDGLFSEDDAEDVDGDGHISEFYVYIKDYPSQVPGIFDFDYSYREGIDNDDDGLLNEDEVGLVDLNRNYDSFWDEGGPEYEDVTTQVYHGTSPFSEPETQAFRDFALKHKFAMTYSLHSGTNATLFPTDEHDNWCQGPLYYQIASDYRDILPDGFNNGIGYPQSASAKIESALSGSWGEWMYYECGNTVPITFEVYTNASAQENYAMGDVILENDTHIIREWKGIYGYFNPVAEHIQTLWFELLPAFEYLLEMTPCIDIDITAVSGGINSGETLILATSMHCHSARLGSTESIRLLGTDDEMLDTLTIVGAGQTLTDHASFILPEDLSDSGYTILIGNNYTGYTQFILSLGSSPGFDLVLIGITIGVIVVAIAIIVYIKKR